MAKAHVLQEMIESARGGFSIRPALAPGMIARAICEIVLAARWFLRRDRSWRAGRRSPLQRLNGDALDRDAGFTRDGAENQFALNEIARRDECRHAGLAVEAE